MGKMGYCNIHEYMNRLYESINVDKIEDKDGIIIPDDSKKSYDWLKKEYTSAKQEVKVEMKIGGAKFTPGYDMQADVETAGKEFKPGMFGNSVPKTTKSGTETDFKATKYTSSSDSSSNNTSKTNQSSQTETNDTDETKKDDSKEDTTKETSDNENETKKDVKKTGTNIKNTN